MSARRTYAWPPLWALASGRGLTMAQLGAVTGGAVYRWRRYGYLGEAAADRAAVALGVLPGEVWEEWEADSGRLLQAAEAERRAKVARRQRQLRASNTAYAERQRQSSAAWKERNRRRVAAVTAAYEDANRERLTAVRRARRQANPEHHRAQQRAYRARRRLQVEIPEVMSDHGKIREGLHLYAVDHNANASVNIRAWSQAESEAS